MTGKAIIIAGTGVVFTEAKRVTRKLALRIAKVAHLPETREMADWIIANIHEAKANENGVSFDYYEGMPIAHIV